MIVQGEPPIIKYEKGISAQRAEIIAMILAFEKVKEPFNLYTDSRYVAGLFPAIETTMISIRTEINDLLNKLKELAQKRKFKYHMAHIRGHTKLPWPLAQGNAIADSIHEFSLLLRMQWRVINYIKMHLL